VLRISDLKLFVLFLFVMIARVTGQIILRGDKFLVLENNGIGYKIFVTADELRSSVGKNILTLWTRHHIREDANELYGFSEMENLNFFELLVQISGIGPKSALGILSVAPIETLSQAIRTGDNSYLTKVSGIGRKTADKIILELRDKIESLFGESNSSSFKEERDTIEALKSLGYPLRDARDALRAVPEGTISTNDKIKEALKILGKNKI